MKAIYNPDSNTIFKFIPGHGPLHPEKNIPCDPSCKALWKDGEVLEEGNDFVIQDHGHFSSLATWVPVLIAYPIKPSLSTKEDQIALWNEAKNMIWEGADMYEMAKEFSITRVNEGRKQ